MHRPVSRAAALLICWVASAASPALADVLDPEDSASLGTLAWSSGGYTIDTDALTIDGTANGNVQARGWRRASTGDASRAPVRSRWRRITTLSDDFANER